MCKTIELRDQIALEVMRAAITRGEDYTADHLAARAYKLADAMMKARQRETRVEVKITSDEQEAEILAEAIRKFERMEPGYTL